ncbi:TETRASPANIN-8-RELATED [Salix viminalis]|uniref:TETRASPANIN-8-RELATED n=1 Tax=Salix viminalis TaxID=40686 RepID=A0A9Q0NVX2_SALVM|nr:TETRASPANIN-8-RELATED [Salix viminalis]
MVRVSNTILAIFNCVTLLAGLVIMGLGLYIFARGGATGCDKVLQNPLIVVGVAITAISLLGLIGSCCRVNFALTLYLILLFLLLLCLIGFTVFAILVTNESIGKAFSKTKIMDFQNWLRDNLADEKHWNDMKSCAVQTKICQDNNHKKLSDIQSGCCQPPVSCGFVSNNATLWNRPKTRAAVKYDSGDCTAWSNQQDTLCFNCESCKAAYAATSRKEWGQLAVANSCFVAFALLFYSIACCARSNNKNDDSHHRFRGYP